MANSNCPEPNLSVIVLAAGKGTRMKSTVPKVLHKLCGLTLLERTLRAVIKLKPRDIFIVVGYQKETVSAAIAAFAKSQNDVETTFHIVTQEPQLGTGHAVQTVFADHEIHSEYTLILPGDIPLLTTEPLESLCTTCRNNILKLGLISFTPPDPALFGRIVRDGNSKLTAIREAKDCSPEELMITEVNSSIYLAHTPTLQEAIRHLTPNNFQKELYLTDIVSWSIANNIAVDTHSVNASSTEGQSCPDYLTFAGANSIAELYELEKHRRAQIVRGLQDSGVTIENIDCVYVDEDVIVEQDCFLGANTRLRGKTHVKQGCILQGDSLVDNSTIGENAVLKLGSVIESSVVGANCAIGPYAHLREGSVLQDNVKVGNFVETKKSLLKSGVKAGHLSYLGDSVVGESSNIGAGTITCNYDGAEKHQTIIGRNVFIGSNSALVAPITIGSDAYVGAGSVITDSVPANSLGVARERQVVIENWAERRNKK